MRLSDFPRPPLELSGGANYGMSMHLTAAADMPLGYDPDAAVRELVAMKMGWAKGLNLWNQDAGRRLLDAGIMPVHRPYQDYDGAADCSGENWERSHDLVYAGVLYQESIWNEPNLEAGWGGDALSYYRVLWPNWRAWAVSIISAGGYPGTPAEAPGGSWGWKDGLWALLTVAGENGALGLFGQGAWIAVHNYWSNHPTDYPFDAINQADHPGATLEQDSYAFLMPLEAHRVLATFIGNADDVPIISTEGGPYVENQDDGRYPMTTLASYSDMVLECREYMALEAPDWWLCTNWWLHRWESGLGSPSFMKHAWFWSSWPNGRMPIVTALETLPALVRVGGTVPPAPSPVPSPVPPVVPPLPPLTTHWRLVSARRLSGAENHGNHHIYFTPPDMPMLVKWPDGEAVAVGNFPMYPGSYTAQVADADSDVATELHTDIWEDSPEPGNSYGHYSYEVEFEKVEEEPMPTYTREEIIAIISEEAARVGIAPALALAMAEMESGLNPNAVGDDGHSVGLYQLHDQGMGAGMGDSRYDPRINAVTALGVLAARIADSSEVDAIGRHNAGDAGWADPETRELVMGAYVMPVLALKARWETILNALPPDWNGMDWWQALSERDRWLRYVAVNDANREFEDATVPALRQEIAELQARIRAAKATLRNLIAALEG